MATADLYAGVWRAGDDPYYLWVADWNGFSAKWQELSNQNLLLVDLKVYTVGGATMYAGVWRAGSDAHYLWVGVDWNSFKAKWHELSHQGLRLVDVEVYEDGGSTKYAGVWRAGHDAHYLWVGVDWENFNAKWYELAQQNLRLTSLEIYPGSCDSGCSNQVLMPDDPATPWKETYNYGITGDTVSYRWPCIDSSGIIRYVRLSALYFDGAPFSIPFSDQAVKRRGTWLYSPGSWHHAIDFSRDDADTFQVRAAATGRVIFLRLDQWSGNTSVMSHDSGRVTDAFRTIYMHLRNGPIHDSDASWNQTVPNLNEPGLSQYKP